MKPQRNKNRTWDVVIIGGGGLQARAAIEGVTRGGAVDAGRWLAVDRQWMADRRAGAEQAGFKVMEQDCLSDPTVLRELVRSARLIANFIGPYYRTGGKVLDACIAEGTDYIDICDDADATVDLLKRDVEACNAGISALTGMGSSPGISNVLARTAVDALGGEVDTIDISWIVDVADVGIAAAQHFWHIFSGVDSSGKTSAVPSWEDIEMRQVEFPSPLGEHTLLRLSHPEPITMPRFLKVGRVANYGGLAPVDAQTVSWALARLGGGALDKLSLKGGSMPISEIAGELYERYRAERAPTPYLGGGLVVEVRKKGQGYRFASGDVVSMEESTGTPAAAGIMLMLKGELSEPGVFAPECLSPANFFPALANVSRNSGSLTLHHLVDNKPPERLRVRDLINMDQTP